MTPGRHETHRSTICNSPDKESFRQQHLSTTIPHQCNSTNGHGHVGHLPSCSPKVRDSVSVSFLLPWFLNFNDFILRHHIFFLHLLDILFSRHVCQSNMLLLFYQALLKTIETLSVVAFDDVMPLVHSSGTDRLHSLFSH